METELKLELAPGDAALLAAAPALAEAGAPDRRRLRSTYHDTAERTLRRAGFTLRVREDGDRRVQTVKAEGAAAAGLFARPEWEQEVPGDTPVLDAAAGPLAPVLGGRAVAPLFTTDVTRTRWMLERDGARIEVALDEGEIRAGEAAAPLAELELELLAGPVPPLFALARALDAAAPLRLAVRSKAERGYRLGGGAAAGKAEPVALDPDGDAIQAFVAIAHSCLRQYRLNEALLLAGSDAPAPLHQARVGLRRLRSAFSLFRPLLAEDPAAARFAAGLRGLAAAVGEVRDLDVLVGHHQGDVRARIAAARIQAFDAARARLETPETRALLLDLVEWLAIGDWRTRPADAEAAHQAVTPFAAELLARRRRRLKRRGRHLARLDADERHRVRIDGKKLRYAAEFFAGLWTGKKARRRRDAFTDAMEALQEELGALNDAHAGAAVLARLGLVTREPTARDPAPGLARAEEALERLTDLKPFWR